MRLQAREPRAAGSTVGHVGRARRGLTAPQAGGRRPAQTTGPLGISQETALASEDCRTRQETRRWEPGGEKSPENNGDNSAKEKTRDRGRGQGGLT